MFLKILSSLTMVSTGVASVGAGAIVNSKTNLNVLNYYNQNQNKYSSASDVNINHYKYVKNLNPSLPHDNYEYDIAVGWNDLDTWVGSTYNYTFNAAPWDLIPIFHYIHEAGKAPGKVLNLNPDPSIKDDDNIYSLEYYFNSAGAFRYVGFPIKMPLFISDFDSDMNGVESMMFSEDWLVKSIVQSNVWVEAWKNHESVYMKYETWYNDILHFTMGCYEPVEGYTFRVADSNFLESVFG